MMQDIDKCTWVKYTRDVMLVPWLWECLRRSIFGEQNEILLILNKG